MTGRGRADLLADLHRELLEHAARLESLVEQLLHDGPQLAPSASTVCQAAAATAADQIPLTKREAQILQLLVTGRTNRQIGAEVRLVGSTVRNYLRPIYQKLGVTNRTQAAIRALELGLVTRVGPDPELRQRTTAPTSFAVTGGDRAGIGEPAAITTSGLPPERTPRTAEKLSRRVRREAMSEMRTNTLPTEAETRSETMSEMPTEPTPTESETAGPVLS